MEALVAILVLLVVVAILFEVAERVGIPYPVLLVLGGLGLAFVPGLPRFTLDPELVLLVFLPPLLFSAAAETPLQDLRANIGPIGRLSVGLVIFTIVVVAVVAHAAIPDLGWAPAFTLGAIVSATDPVAATTIFRRLGVPRRIVTVLEGEGLLNDATALVAYRTAVMAAAAGSFVAAQAFASFVVAAAGGILLGVLVSLVFSEALRRLDDPPVEVAVTLVVPYAAYLPADELGLSGVLAAVAAGLVLGRRSTIISSPDTRILGRSTWQMVTFLLNGFAFLLIGLELPDILDALADQPPAELLGLGLLVSGAVIAARFAWIYVVSLLPGSLTRTIARTDPQLAKRAIFLISWSGLRGVVALAAALALPADFPQRPLIVLTAFAVIVVTLVGQGATLPLVLRWLRFEGPVREQDEETMARAVANEAGLAEIERQRARWPTHQPLLDRFESSLRDRARHLATDDPVETGERLQERLEHEEIQREVISAQRLAVIDLRDRGEINDEVLRTIERELDLEEIRMEA